MAGYSVILADAWDDTTDEFHAYAYHYGEAATLREVIALMGRARVDALRRGRGEVVVVTDIRGHRVNLAREMLACN